jgi:hypothetical protein
VRFQRRDFIEPLQDNDRSLSDEALQRCSEHAFETTKAGHLAGHELTEASAPIRIARTNSTKEQRFGYGTDRGGGREAVWRIRCARREDGAVGWEGRGARLIVKSVDDGAGALGERQSLNLFLRARVGEEPPQGNQIYIGQPQLICEEVRVGRSDGPSLGESIRESREGRRGTCAACLIFETYS